MSDIGNLCQTSAGDLCQTSAVISMSPTGSQPKGAPGPPGIGKWWPEGGNDVDTVQSGAPGIGKWGIGKWGPERGKTSLCKPHPCVYVRVSGRRRLEGPVKAHVKEQMKGLVKGRLKGQLKRRAKGRVKGVGGGWRDW